MSFYGNEKAIDDLVHNFGKAVEILGRMENILGSLRVQSDNQFKLVEDIQKRMTNFELRFLSQYQYRGATYQNPSVQQSYSYDRYTTDAFGRPVAYTPAGTPPNFPFPGYEGGSFQNKEHRFGQHSQNRTEILDVQRAIDTALNHQSAIFQRQLDHIMFLVRNMYSIKGFPSDNPGEGGATDTRESLATEAMKDAFRPDPSPGEPKVAEDTDTAKKETPINKEPPNRAFTQEMATAHAAGLNPYSFNEGISNPPFGPMSMSSQAWDGQ